MNRERAKELIPIIQAFAEGRQVQVRIGKDWHDLEDAVWDDDNEYRIKPERRKVWVHFPEDGRVELGGHTCLSETCKVVCVEEPEQ